MKSLIVLCGLLIMPTLAWAQAPVVASPYNLTFCWNQKDSGGVTNAVGPFQVAVTTDTTTAPAVTLPAATGAAGTGGCPAGSFPYLLTGLTATPGAHTTAIILSNAAGPGLPSTPPFAFVVGVPPGRPTNVSVQ